MRYDKEFEKDLDTLLQQSGDSIVDLFKQMMKGDWEDSMGHPVTMNTSMLQMRNTLKDIMDFRTKYLNYTSRSGYGQAD